MEISQIPLTKVIVPTYPPLEHYCCGFCIRFWCKYKHNTNNKFYNHKWYMVKHITPPKNIIINKKFLHFIALGSYGHHVLNFFCSFQVYLTSFQLKLVNSLKISNKH